MPQVVFLPARGVVRGFRLFEGGPSGAPGGMGLRKPLPLRPVAGKAVQHVQVPSGVEQAAPIRLALDLDQHAADAREQGDARRRVVDERAAAPVGADDAAHQELAVMVEVVLGQQRADRIGLPDIEGGGDAGALAAARHDAGRGAVAERQAERIQQDGLAGAGLPGEDRHSLAEVDVQAAYQDVVADREASKHLPRVRAGRRRRG